MLHQSLLQRYGILFLQTEEKLFFSYYALKNRGLSDSESVSSSKVCLSMEKATEANSWSSGFLGRISEWCASKHLLASI